MNMHNMAHNAHPDDPHKQSEHNAVHKLISAHNATHTAVKNGSWFNPSTWKGEKVPGANAKVIIPKGITVDYDSVSNTRLFGLRVDGQIDFATNANTKMVIDTFVVSSDGTLTIGTEKNPVQGNVKTEILIANNGAIDTKWDPQQLSRGVISHGTVEIHGQAKTSHLKVTLDPTAGDKTLTLEKVPVNWQVGDRIVLTGTQYQANGKSQDEERTISSINGNRITLDKPLSYNHDTPRNDLKAYVANQSRNIVFATENSGKVPSNQRGHIMFMHSDNVDVRYAEFNELGRTDKSKLLDDFKTTSGHAPKRILDGHKNPITGARTNIRGRYALHLHRTGVNSHDQPAVIVGNSVVGSPGWGIVQHDSHAVLENNLTYDVFGAGFVSETGNEIGAWRNNIAIKSEGRSGNEKGGAYNHDLGFGGHGFWFQGRLVESDGNVAAGHRGSGMFYFHRGVDEIDPLAKNLAIEAWAKGQHTVETSDSPIMGFTNNEVLASGNGITVIKNSQVQHHDGRTILDNFKAWEVVQGTEFQYTAHYTLRDFDLVGTKTSLHKNAENDGVHLFHNVEDMVFDGLNVEGFRRGVNLNKETRVVKPLKDWGYIFIDTNLKNNDKNWINLNPNVDQFLSRKDIKPGQLSFKLDNAKSDFVATTNDNKAKIAVAVVGTKTDSLGTVALPFGNEDLGYPLHQLRSIAKQKGYYTLPNGKHGVVIDEYISDRLTGDMRKYSFVATLDNKNWTQHAGARHLGQLNPAQLPQDNRIIPFKTLDFNHPTFTNGKIKPSTPKPHHPKSPVSDPITPVVEPPAVEPTDPTIIESPVVEPPTTEPMPENAPRPKVDDYDIVAGDGNDFIRLGKDQNSVNAGNGNNKIYVQSSNSPKTILAGNGNDKVHAGNGDDRIDLGTATSQDVAFGRGGSDTFVLNQGSGLLSIRDFQQGVDKLELNGLKFGDLAQTTRNGKTWLSVGDDVLVELTKFTQPLTEKDFVTGGYTAPKPVDKPADDSNKDVSHDHKDSDHDKTPDIGGDNGSNTPPKTVETDVTHDHKDADHDKPLAIGDDHTSHQPKTGSYDIVAGDGNDSIQLGKGQDSVNAGNGNNKIYVRIADDLINSDKDILTGSGNDKVHAGNGDDRLDLGTAKDFDIAFGRGGSDTFVINEGSGVLIVRDFEHGTDMFELNDGLSFGALEQTSRNGKTWLSSGNDVLVELTNFSGTLTTEDFTTAG